jgi:hypothetical protein
MYNWNTLNAKVLKKIGIKLTKKEIEDIVAMEQDCIELFIARLKYRVDQVL